MNILRIEFLGTNRLVEFGLRNTLFRGTYSICKRITLWSVRKLTIHLLLPYKLKEKAVLRCFEGENIDKASLRPVCF